MLLSRHHRRNHRLQHLRRIARAEPDLQSPLAAVDVDEVLRHRPILDRGLGPPQLAEGADAATSSLLSLSLNQQDQGSNDDTTDDRFNKC